MVHAKKSLGQNFLHNQHVIERITALLRSDDQTRILEIGPGHGALTGSLERRPHADLLLLEKDRELASERKRSAQPGTVCLLTDALTFPWERLDERWIVCGNLPYNVASPLIWEISSRSHIRQAVFMVQKEVGERLTARPDSKAFGALSVWVQSFWEGRLAFSVGPGNFTPPPKVESAVVTFTPGADPLPDDLKGPMKMFLDICFQNRRKQLGGILRRRYPDGYETLFERVRIQPQARPEALTVAQFRQCARWFSDRLRADGSHQTDAMQTGAE